MGRKKQFNEAEVLDKAMMTFWKNGYENTTVRQLEHDMGINQFSIYSTFTNKDELFRRVLQNYSDKCDKEFLYDLQKPECDLGDVAHFLKSFAGQIIKGNVPNSCLMVQSAIHLDKQTEQMKELVLKFFETMKTLFTKSVRNSIKSGDLDSSTEVEQTADYLLGIAQSISIFTKIKSEKEVNNYIDFALAKIE